MIEFDRLQEVCKFCQPLHVNGDRITGCTNPIFIGIAESPECKETICPCESESIVRKLLKEYEYFTTKSMATKE